MTRLTRYRPPEPRDIAIARPQVQRVLAGRFDRRVTSLVAGAGFGKTTALAQAVEENLIAPVGVDVWFGCDSDDGDPHVLAEGLAHAWALTLESSPAPSPSSIADACAGAAMLEICLILDDAHHISASDDAVAWLRELADALPSNGHFVLAGRGHVPAVVAEREHVELAEADLAFTAEQVAEFGRRLGRAPSADRASHAGWPALVELSARHGVSRDLLDEHVFDDVDSRASRLIDGLVAAGRADVALLSATVGDVTVHDVRQLPLVDQLGDEFVAHTVWHEARNGDARVARLRARIIDELDRRGQMDRVVDVSISAHEAHERFGMPPPDGEVWQRALLAAIRRHALAHPETLRRWGRGLSKQLAASGAGLLTAGLVARLDRPADDHTVEVLQRAADAFADGGDLRSEAVALSAMTYPLHTRNDAAALRTTYERLIELSSQGIGEADEQSRMASAVIATATGDLEDVRDITRGILETARTGPTRTAALWMLCNAHNGLGESSLGPADELAGAPAQLPGMCAAAFTARWKLGMIRELIDRPAVATTGHRDRYVMAVWYAFLATATGDPDGADAHLDIVRAASDGRRSIAPDGSNVFPEVALDLERGHDDRAAERMRTYVSSYPIDGPARAAHVMAVGLLYPHVPELRPTLDALTAGPLFRIERDLAKGLAELIDGHAPEHVEKATLPANVGKLLSTFGLRHTVEYLSAAVSLGVDRADHLVEELVDLVGAPARTRLVRTADHPNVTVSSGARRILGAVPVRPAGELDVRLFGHASIEVDGRPIDDSNWRRERVRALLAFIALHPTPTREIAMAELWPDMSADAARKNLRTTINRLHQVLEPDRRSGHAPYHLRSSGQLLSLHTGDRIRLDVEQFAHDLDRAHRREDDGTPSMAVDAYLSALERYRGDLLPDSYDSWVLVRRDALRSQFVQAGVRCAELLSASDRGDEAVELLTRVLGIEPYSESAHRALVVAHLRLGDAATARRAMETCERVLAEIGGVSEDATAMVWRRAGRRTAESWLG